MKYSFNLMQNKYYLHFNHSQKRKLGEKSKRETHRESLSYVESCLKIFVNNKIHENKLNNALKIK